MGLLEEGAGLGDEVGVFGGEVVFFGEVVGEVEEKDGAVGIIADVSLNGFEVAETDSAFSASLVEFPIEIFVGFLCAGFAQEGGDEADAVDIGGCVDAGEVAGGGEEVPEGGDEIGGSAGCDAARPTGDGGDADAAVGEASFPAGERAVGVEPIELFAAFEVGAIVAGEEEEGVAVDAEGTELVADPADFPVHAGNHGGEGGLGFVDGTVVVLLAGFFFELALVEFHPFLGGVETGVGDLEREVEEEGGVLVLFEVIEGVAEEKVVAVGIAFVETVVGIGDLVAVAVELFGEVVVSVGVAEVAEEIVEALLIGLVRGAPAAGAGFADHGGVVTGFLEQGGDGDVVGVGTELEVSIAADPGMAGVIAGE